MHHAAAVGSDPQAAIARGQQAEDTVIDKLGSRRMIVEPKMRSIEFHQAAGSPHPKVAVLRLRDRLHGIFGQTVLDSPDAAHVLFGGSRIRWIGDRRRLSGYMEKCCKDNQPKHYAASPRD